MMSQTRIVKRGPCNHCGIESTAEWRHGPDHKPTLCNACGMRWKIHHNFIDYTPKHGYAEGYGSEVTPKQKKHYRVGAHIPKKAESRPKTQKCSDGSKGDAAKAGLEISSSDKHIKSESGQEDSGTTHLGFGNFPRRKKSTLDPVGTLQRKLKGLLQQPEFSHLREEEDPLLIVPNNQMSSGEIGLGCELLKPPGSSIE